MGTKFSDIYNRFLGKITDDMYMELTPRDTIKDLRSLLVQAIPEFEFPRVNIQDYNIAETVKQEDEVEDQDFVIGMLWDDTIEDADLGEPPEVVVEESAFYVDLTTEEINILAILMMTAWLQRQVTSIENVRMKYSGSDFKMTSQANHLSKLQSLLGECQRQSIHLQRLYKRRRLTNNGTYASNWVVLNHLDGR